MNPEGWLATRSGGLSAWLAVLICAGVLLLAWLGYRATEEWHRRSAELVVRRTEDIADLLTRAITRDMRAVQMTVLDGREWDARALAAPAEMNDLVQASFARYPYPEAFFAWLPAGAPMIFARRDRTPSWLPPDTDDNTFPVQIVRGPTATRPLFDRVARETGLRSQYALFESDIAGTHYQVVARLIYSDATHDHPAGAFGFIVNLDGIARQYLASITEQVRRIAHTAETVDCSIVDDKGATVIGPARASSSAAVRTFPVFFFDPAIVASVAPADLVTRSWSVKVSSDRDPTLAIAAQGARRTLLVVTAGALALGFGLFVTARASRAAAATTAMRTDFVSTVTHALKTPVSVIRGIGETLVRGRVTTRDQLEAYAQLLVSESHRLTRLIDNLLAYARVTDVATAYVFEAQDVEDVLQEVARGFQRQLTDHPAAPRLSVEPDLPQVRADRTSLVLALDNLLDNALRYAGESQPIDIRAVRHHAGVEFVVKDGGPGIPPGDLAQVQRRFVRGRSARGHGSGLGLAIAHRIARDHRGHLTVESVVGQGTTVRLTIPTWSV